MGLLVALNVIQIVIFLVYECKNKCKLKALAQQEKRRLQALAEKKKKNQITPNEKPKPKEELAEISEESSSSSSSSINISEPEIKEESKIPSEAQLKRERDVLSYNDLMRELETELDGKESMCRSRRQRIQVADANQQELIR